MKQYHTSVIIEASAAQVWNELTNFSDYPVWNPIVGKLEGPMNEGSKISTFIVPLNNTFSPVLCSFKKDREMAWKGSLVSRFLLQAHHYYSLEEYKHGRTELKHGEYFTGLLSYLLPKTLMGSMHEAFKQHNILLKARVERRKPL
ncbi:MAG: SRPBCC domain-containing protein [Chitinophagales bacterium]|nr:SRPBCC domain-containing protein [Chitinophagales bacterium]